METLRVLTIVTYICLVASYLWATARFFKVSDQSGSKGRQVYSLLATPMLLALLAGFFIVREVTLPELLGGGGLLVLALTVFWSAILANLKKPLGYAFSEDKPSQITMHGPYRFVRHPFYVAYTLGWIGGIVLTKQYWLVALLIGLLVYYVRAAQYEENLFLSGSLAKNYQDYMLKTGRFFPRLRPRVGEGGSNES